MQAVDMGKDGACHYCGADAVTLLIRYERAGEIGFEAVCFSCLDRHYGYGPANARSIAAVSIVGMHKRSTANV